MEHRMYTFTDRYGDCLQVWTGVWFDILVRQVLLLDFTLYSLPSCFCLARLSPQPESRALEGFERRETKQTNWDVDRLCFVAFCWLALNPLESDCIPWPLHCADTSPLIAETKRIQWKFDSDRACDSIVLNFNQLWNLPSLTQEKLLAGFKHMDFQQKSLPETPASLWSLKPGTNLTPNHNGFDCTICIHLHDLDVL